MPPSPARGERPSRLGCAALAALLAAAVAGAGAEERGLRTYLERNPIHLGETVRLVLEIDTSASGLRPDVAPLREEFEVLDISTSTRIRLVEGRQSATTQWLLELDPKEPGALAVPSIAVGPHRSQPLVLTVLPERRGDDGGKVDVFLEATLEPEHAYVQAQLTYAVRLYRAVDIVDGTITEPAPENASVRRLGSDVSYTTTRGGRRYRVLERRHAVFPQTSGELVIPPVEFQGEVAEPGEAGSTFSRLFGRGRRVRLRSGAVRATVHPPPAEFPGRTWLPARALHLEEEWSREPEELRAGEPVTRTVRMRATGLAAEQLPDMTAGDAEGVKSYRDQPAASTSTDNEWVRGVREQRIALLPEAAGTIVLPAIRVPWWDTASNALRVATLPTRELQVAPAETRAPADATSGEPRLAGDAPTSSREWRERPGLWQAASAVLLIAWLATLAAWQRAARRPRNGSPEPVPAAPASPRPPPEALRRACLAGDANGAGHALLAWGRATWPEDPPGNLVALAERLEDAETASALVALDRALYARPGEPWNGRELWERARKGLRPRRPRNDVVGDGLVEMYPRPRS